MATLKELCAASRDPMTLRLFIAALGLRFDLVWDRCALRGWCDERGGAEYERVSNEWLDEGAPLEMARFIREHSNTPPKKEDK